MPPLVSCEVADCGDSGLGVVASRALIRGDVVCVASALVEGAATVADVLLAVARAHASSDADTTRLVRACWAFCPEPVDDAVAAAHCNASDDALERILEDALPGIDERALARAHGLSTPADLRRLAAKLARNGFAEGVFPDACRFNHACRPNCTFVTARAEATGRTALRVIVSEPVAAGAELTIGYLEEARWHLPTDQRRALLMQRYGFWCRCRRCHRPAQSKAVRAAERHLEAVRCASRECAQGSAGGAAVHLAVDEHERPDGERADGYTPCAVCGAEADARTLDAELVRIHAAVSHACAAQAVAGADADDDHGLLDAWRGAWRTLHPQHWLCLELHARVQAWSADALAQLVPTEPRNRAWRHALALLLGAHSAALAHGMEHIAPEGSHVLAALQLRAADALDALVAEVRDHRSVAASWAPTTPFGLAVLLHERVLPLPWLEAALLEGDQSHSAAQRGVSSLPAARVAMPMAAGCAADPQAHSVPEGEVGPSDNSLHAVLHHESALEVLDKRAAAWRARGQAVLDSLQ